MENGETQTLTESPGPNITSWDIESLAVSPDGRHLIFSVNADGSSRLKLIRIDGWKELPMPALPDGRIRRLTFSPDGSRIGFQLETPRLAGDVYSIALGGDENSDDRAAGELTRWTYSETAGLPEEHFIEPDLIRYSSFDELSIPAMYFKPPGEGPFPVIVRIHGGPEGQSRPGFDANLQYWLRELGVAVLVPNVRGSTGYGPRIFAARQWLQT